MLPAEVRQSKVLFLSVTTREKISFFRVGLFSAMSSLFVYLVLFIRDFDVEKAPSSALMSKKAMMSYRENVC